MSSQAYAPYRVCGITVHVTVAKSQALGGECRRFRVSWTVSLPGDTQQKLANFPQQFDFLTEQEAFR
ncbi:hypothetical protein CA601_32825, partial [Paraburkholderia hospita]